MWSSIQYSPLTFTYVYNLKHSWQQQLMSNILSPQTAFKKVQKPPKTMFPWPFEGALNLGLGGVLQGV